MVQSFEVVLCVGRAFPDDVQGRRYDDVRGTEALARIILKYPMTHNR